MCNPINSNSDEGAIKPPTMRESGANPFVLGRRAISMRAWMAVVALLAVGLAGCSESAPADDGVELGDGTKVDFDDVQTTDTLGAISGVIVDDTITPVADITVQIVGGDSQTTGDDGIFVFEGLEPGVYFLEVNGTGYGAVQTTADVQAGEVSKLRIIVPRDYSPQPYHVTYDFQWFDDVGIVLVDFVVDLVDEAFLGNQIPNQCKNCFFDFETDGPVEMFVVEATWQESISDPTGETSFYWNLAESDDWGNYEDDYFDQADPAYIGDNRFGDVTGFTVSMYGDETWVSIDQSAELYVTMFYLEPAPEGWSFIRGT